MPPFTLHPDRFGPPLMGVTRDRLTYSTVTDFARFRGWSTLQPRFTAM